MVIKTGGFKNPHNQRENMKKEVNINNVECLWYWENDHRKSSKIFVTPKNSDIVQQGTGIILHNYKEYVIEKSTDLTKLIKKEGIRFYTCDDDYKDGDDYRYGYFYPAKSINHDPVDQMEGDGHAHLFCKENGKYERV